MNSEDQASDPSVREAPSTPHVLTKLSHIVSSSTDLKTLLDQAIDLFHQHFHCHYTRFYLIEQSEISRPPVATIYLAKGSAEIDRKLGSKNIEITPSILPVSPVAQAIASNQSQVAPFQEKALPSATRPLTEVATPVSWGEHVLGAILTFIPDDHPSAESKVADVQAFANLLALAMVNLRLMGSASVPAQKVKESVRAQEEAQRRLNELETLWKISESISIEAEPSVLFQILHQQVEKVMGVLDSFAVALYEAKTELISIPYMVEEGRMLVIPPFPLGEGLTSIVIRTQRPLLLVEDAEKKADELGAKIIGTPAKSWLGVPLLFSGEPIGAIIVQDIHRERRFNENDQRLLSTLASQVAVVIHNARLLEVSRKQTEQERLVSEIGSKIRRAVDIQSILKITADELGDILRARRAHIMVYLESPTYEEQASGDR